MIQVSITSAKPKASSENPARTNPRAKFLVYVRTLDKSMTAAPGPAPV